MGFPPFYLVWREDGEAPARKHDSEERAQAEAMRLARMNPGVTFHVLPVAMSVTSNDLQVERYCTDEIPF